MKYEIKAEKLEQLIKKQRDMIDHLQDIASNIDDLDKTDIEICEDFESEIAQIEAEIAKEKDVECKHPIFTTHTGDYCYCLDCESLFFSPVSFTEPKGKDEPKMSPEEVINKFIDEEGVQFNQERDDWMIEAMEFYHNQFKQ
jgi:hypothetical protein